MKINMRHKIATTIQEWKFVAVSPQNKNDTGVYEKIILVQIHNYKHADDASDIFLSKETKSYMIAGRKTINDITLPPNQHSTDYNMRP